MQKSALHGGGRRAKYYVEPKKKADRFIWRSVKSWKRAPASNRIFALLYTLYFSLGVLCSAFWRDDFARQPRKRKECSVLGILYFASWFVFRSLRK